MAGAGYKHLEIVQDFEKYVKDKKASSRAYYRYLLSRLLRMFQYKNLPDTIPHEILDRYLFEFGIACITEVEGNLYVFSGNLGGPQDVYYRPTQFIISNPHIKKGGEIFSANVPVYKTNVNDAGDSVGQPIQQVDGVLMRNDLDWVGLHPLISRYAYLMAENVLTLRTADVMLRIIALLTAKTDAERAASIEYLKSIEKGELGVIGESAFHEGVEMQSPPSNNGSYLTQFIEYQQYLKGSFYNEIGLSANYNMKREAIGKGESTLDEDALLPLCDNMLTCRREDLAKVNEMFGTNIEVEFSSSWLENRIEALSALRDMAGGSSNGMSIGQPTGIPQPVPSNDSVPSNDTVAPVEVGQPSEPASDDEVGSNSSEAGASKGLVEEREEIVTDEWTEGTDADKETDADEGSESTINDLSQDEELTDLLEKATEEPETVIPLVNQEEGGDMNESSEREESADDETDSSDN